MKFWKLFPLQRALDRQCDAAEVGQPLLVLAAEGQRHQPGAGRQYLVAELAGHLIAKAAGPHAGNRQATGGNHQRGAMEPALGGVHAAIAAVLDALHAAVGTDLYAGRWHSSTSIFTICLDEISNCPSSFS